MDRRTFLHTAALAATLSTLTPRPAAAATPTGPKVCVFSKHLQFLDIPTLAATARDLGMDGLDLTVRKGGHVLPENVATDLPKAVETIRAQNIEVSMITTSLNDGSDPDARPILEAAGKAGIPYARIGGQQYPPKGDIIPYLDKCTEEVRTLTKIAEECNVTLGYHNHSGRGNVGATLWDLYRMYETIGSKSLGSNFDLGHACVEGTYGGWQTTGRLLAPHTKMMAAKDFVWDRDKPKWVPLGEGIVPFVPLLKYFRAADFAGPISLHFEYDVPSNDAMLEEIRKAIATLRGYIRDAGFN